MNYGIRSGTPNVTPSVEVLSPGANSNDTLAFKATLHGPVFQRDNTNTYSYSTSNFNCMFTINSTTTTFSSTSTYILL